VLCGGGWVGMDDSFWFLGGFGGGGGAFI